MKLLVSYELTAECTAYVEYDELARAWAEDAREFGKDARPPLPSRKTLRRSLNVAVGQYADGSVDRLLTKKGSETDSRLAKIIDISEVP